MAKSSSLSLEQRVEFCARVRQRDPGVKSFAKLCQETGITRATGYAWMERAREQGRNGLAARSHARRGCCEGKAVRRWSTVLLEMRARRPSWGADKLLAVMAREHPRAKLPSRSAVTRLLQRRGLAAGRKARAKRGPAVARLSQTAVERGNDLWTVDLKGWFRTGNGERCEPLTVRDLHSRFVLCVRAVAQCSETVVRRRMRELFLEYGVPRAIRVDNGVPFGSPTTGAALGLTRLSVWWLRLGIAVEFTRRGCPQDNGAHEQMHRVLKAETARPPAQNLAAQSRRMEAWRRDYNEERPHAALGQRTPAQCYLPQYREYKAPRALHYPSDWAVRKVSEKGTIRWDGQARQIGRAFTGEHLGLCKQEAVESLSWEVYLGTQLLGELHPSDRGGMRTAQWSSPWKPTAVTETTLKTKVRRGAARR
jgi:putative transposase